MAGAGYKLFNTGDVLTAAQVNTYLMQQTVMVFASSAARTTALSGVLAEGMVSYLQDTNTLEVYDGSAWVGATGDITGLTAGTGISISSATGPVPTITSDVATTFDAKGDLVVGTGADTFSKLTVGNSGDTIVADSSASTGLRWNPSSSAGKNFLINGNFDIWQRGTSFANTSGYTVDRWTNGGVLNAVTYSQQTTGAPDGSRYYVRLTSTAGSSYSDFSQIIETNNVSQLWGRSVTFSIKVRRNSTVNNTGLIFAVRKSSTADAGTGASWSNISSENIANASIPTGTTSADWYNYKVTVAIPNDGTANSLQVYIAYNGATANGSIFEFSQAQLEIGSIQTTFSRAGGTLAGELAACQRYYWRRTGIQYLGAGHAKTSTVGDFVIQYPVEMRIAPSLATNSGSAYFAFDLSSGLVTANTIGNFFDTSTLRTLARITSTSLTAGQGGVGQINNAAAYLEASSEL